MTLDHPQFSSADVYSLLNLNGIITRLAANDDQLKTVIDDLSLVIVDTSAPPIFSATDLQVAIDAVYAAGNPMARQFIVDPPTRSLQEMSNLTKIQPFIDLIDGAKTNPSMWLPLLRVFSMLKGMIYLVNNGPDYDANPVFIKDGSFFFTSITDQLDTTKNLLITETGAPLVINGLPIYRPLPTVDHVTLLEFLLRRLELQRLRQLYRISAFEASIDSKYVDGTHEFIQHVFRSDNNSSFNKRLPCGYTDLGKLLFLRSQAGQYRGSEIEIFRPGASTESGVEDRIIIDESMVQTPMGVFRVPRCVVRWDHLLTDVDRSPNANGDPVVFVGLKVVLRVDKRGDYTVGTAHPATISGLNIGTGITMLEKKAVGQTFTNYPAAITGTKAQRYEAIAAEGLEQGRLIGYAQQSGANQFSQYAHIHIETVIVPTHGRPFFDSMVGLPSGQIDELGKIGEFGTDTDTAPWRAFGTGPQHVIDVVANAFPGFTAVQDQAILLRESNDGTIAIWECILPIGLHLMKNGKPFGLDNLNGCQTRFTDAWAIRQVSSVQEALSTVIFDDGLGQPDIFPVDFIGSEVVFWHADGTSTITTILERVGDRLARLPKTDLIKIQSGDIVTFDRRQQSSSFDGSYEREVAVTNFVDLRLRVCRLVDTTVTPWSDGTLSPSPSPAVPWTVLGRSKPDSLVLDALAPYTNRVAAIASKMRWHYAQQFMALASQRQDMVNIASTTQEMQTFLLRWVANYENNKNHDWVVGEGVIIAWPEKTPITKVSLKKYTPPVLPGTDDGITIENVEGWGQVPVLTKFIRSTEHLRYPLRFVTPLTFVSERSFSIPGHMKLAGSFRLQPEDTWIVDETITFVLTQIQNKNGLKQAIVLGTFDIKWNEVASFSNATGVFRIDGDAQYNPSTGYVVINYNQIVDFTVDEVGSIEPTFVYHDLSQVHPIYRFNIGSLGLDIGHLFEVKVFAVAEGTISEKPDVVRLEGITIASGDVYIRINREDAFTAISMRGVLRFRFVLRNLPWITIETVAYDDHGLPISVGYTAGNIRKDMTISTLLETDKRCRQVYLPCKTIYGWTDLGQGNIHTESIPQNASPRFGFFELDNVKGIDTALTIPGPIYHAFKPSDIDYRFLGAWSSPAGLEGLKSVVIARHIHTQETKVFVGVYRQANGSGDTTTFSDELSLATVQDQDSVFLRDTTMDAEWVLDFAGVLCASPDSANSIDKMKLILSGYWYGGHSLEQRAGMFARFRPDTVQFSGIAKVAGNWRLSDVPMSFLYRNNTLLWASHMRPAPIPPNQLYLHCGSLFLDNTCVPTTWTPGNQTCVIDLMGDYQVSYSVGSDVQSATIHWDGSHWKAFVVTSSALTPTTTSSWIEYTGSANYSMPDGVYGSPYTNSACAGLSIYPATISVSLI